MARGQEARRFHEQKYSKSRRKCYGGAKSLQHATYSATIIKRFGFNVDPGTAAALTAMTARSDGLVILVEFHDLEYANKTESAVRCNSI